MAFTFNKVAPVAVSKVALMQAKSSRILDTFTRTKNELTVLNQTLADHMTENEAKIAELKTESASLSFMAGQHATIISNIDKFLQV